MRVITDPMIRAIYRSAQCIAPAARFGLTVGECEAMFDLLRAPLRNETLVILIGYSGQAALTRIKLSKVI